MYYIDHHRPIDSRARRSGVEALTSLASRPPIFLSSPTPFPRLAPPFLPYPNSTQKGSRLATFSFIGS